MEIPGTGSKGGEVNAVEKIYAAIDLKSFYASVECVARGMDPLCTNLVVADETRTDKTICLAVSPSLKAFGIPGRPRLFEVKQTVRRTGDSLYHRPAPDAEIHRHLLTDL